MSVLKQKLKVTVLAGRNLTPKNSDNLNDPYCDVVVLGHDGNKIAKSQQTRVVKGTLNPTWSQLLEFDVPATFAGLKVSCWDKHKFFPDKFLGQATVKFNTAMLTSSEALDEWFPLSRRKAGETISGELHLAVQYGDLVKSDSRSRAPSLLQDLSVLNLKVGSAFTSEETTNKLKGVTHVLVPDEEQSFVVADGPPASAGGPSAVVENTREGPPAASLERLTKDDKDLAFTQKNLEVENNCVAGYGIQYARGNIRVGAGRWYYEVRLVATAGPVHIGWCTSAYNPRASTGDAWIFDGLVQQKKHSAGPAVPYGDPCTAGDVVGCLLDVGTMTIQYWLNGKDLGTAHTGVSSSSRFYPLVGISRRCKVLVNFGKDPFGHAPSDASPLHSNLTDKELEQLLRLFDKYRELGNEELVQQATDAATRAAPGTAGDEMRQGEPAHPVQIEVDLKDAVHGAGIMQLQTDLGVTDDEDPSVLIIAWKLQCARVWEISRHEFVTGLNVHAAPTLDKLRTRVKEWREALRDPTQFKSFYNFVFDYLKEDKKILLIDEALIAWNIALKDRPWPLLDTFFRFLQAANKKAVSRDTWQQLLPFMSAYPTDLKDYDAMASWPSIFDEFNEWLQKQHSDS
eukprot:TRINITY_DN187_c0_g3_i1.p1 TRINITY_DN187_c0_g3~~TRINITY_DN187_c0_g3_i1.p1  ORF type:complete len:626 (+),score=187.98 TRINITY_DN187_c0_g3_i1:243-2120(+)